MRLATQHVRAALLGTTLVGGVALLAGTQVGWADAPAPIDAQQAGDYSEGYAELVKALTPAVVAVRAETSRNGAAEGSMPEPGTPDMREFFERYFGTPEGPMPQERPGGPRVGLGSGFIISADGLIVTNAHVIGGADEVEVVLEDDRSLPATVRGVDPLTDLALLDVDTDEPLPFVSFADSEDVEVGDKVLAIGNPFGLGGTVTSGIVSALGRNLGSGPYDDFLQIDAPINRGNSGGPTFNLDGEVVGVNTAIYSPTGGNVGIGFAIASNLAGEVIADLRDDGTLSRGWLGVGIQNVDETLAGHFGVEAGEGVLVTSVQPESPAEAAELRPGDVITSVDGEAVSSAGMLSRMVASLEPGRETSFGILRDGETETAAVTLGERPQPQELAAADPGAEEDTEAPRLGLTLAPLDEATRARLGLAEDVGVMIAGVEPNSPAAEAGLRRDDVIVRIGETSVGDPEEASEAVREQLADAADGVLMLLNRGGAQRFAVVTVEVS